MIARIALALWCVFGLPRLAKAQPQEAEPRVTSPYTLDYFEGALDRINEIAQTDNGYLWLGAVSGLARFDGHTFERFDRAQTGFPKLVNIQGLYRGLSDTLFIVPDVGEMVVAYANGRFMPRLSYSELDSTHHVSSIWDITQDGTGRLWAGGSGAEGYLPLHEHRGQMRRLTSGWRKGGQAWRTYPDEEGQMWIGARDPVEGGGRGPCITTDVQAWLIKVGDGEVLEETPSPFPNLIIHPSRREVLRSEVLRRSDASIEVALTSTGGIARGRFLLPPDACPRLLGHDGTLWVHVGSDIAGYRAEDPTPLFREDLDNYATGMPVVEDREGNIWVDAETRGLGRIRRTPFQAYLPGDIDAATARRILPNGETATKVMSIVEGRGGSVLLRDGAKRVFRTRGGALQRVQLGEGHPRAKDVYEDERGRRLFLSADFNPTTDGGESVEDQLPTRSLYRRVGGRVEKLFDVPVLKRYFKSSFYPDPRDADVIWINTGDLYRLEDPMGPAPRLERVLDLPFTMDIWRLRRDSRGGLWVATSDGVHHLTETDTTHYTRADGLPEDHVHAIYEDRAGDLWFGTYGGGIARFRDGRFQAVTEADGLAEDVVSAFIEDDFGNLWMRGMHSIHRTAIAELNALLDGHIDRVSSVGYGAESGLLNPESLGGGPALEGPDGRLWFPTDEGAAVVDPEEALRLGTEPPIVHAEQLLVGDSTLVARRGEPLRLAAEERRFTVEYVGLSLRNPKHVTYRYRLDGLDDGWIEAGAERRATYTNVPPGEYTFRVQARSHTGVWSEEDGVLALSVAPFFYETGWFALLCGLVAVGLLAGGYGLRVRQLKAREAELSALVEERTDDLRREKETVAAQAEKLLELDAAKSRFFANVSHELRTPLTLLLGPLRDALSTSDAREGLPARHLPAMYRSAERLRGLVDELLDLARLDAGRLRLRIAEHDLVLLTRRTVLAFSSRAEREGLALAFDTDTERIDAWVDAERYERIVSNLLTNAFKFTPSGGRVRVTLDVDKDVDGEGDVVLTVRDTGEGIRADLLPHVFERFRQGDEATTRRHEGAGIGLALVRELVELHGGEVTVESEVGFGSAFTVRLPLGKDRLPEEHVAEDLPGEEPATRSPATASGDSSPVPFALNDAGAEDPEVEDADAEPAAPPAVSGATVLVVEDHDDMRAYLRDLLAPHYHVEEAADGEAGLETARRLATEENAPDLVISDVMMPGMDGYALCHALKADEALGHVPVVLLTARADEESKLEGLTGGADDYLAKPFSAEELLARCENLIEVRRRLRARFSGEVVVRPSDRAVDATEVVVEREEADWVEAVRAVCEEHIADANFGVDWLADELDVSTRTLRRRLKAASGLTPGAFLRTLRLERAAELLEAGAGSVAEVAAAVGYTNANWFSRAFRQGFGVPPSAWAEGERP